ncbi:MAG: phytanoyl-CoA dioxygenase, partial [Paenibacillus sp.]|nr:phytanoyl-CoA dioxygenase [Paenibacillus sp.]
MSQPNEEHLKFFKENGFVKVGRILTDEELAEARAAAQREIATPTGIVQMEKGGSMPVVRRVSRLMERDEAFLRAAAHPVVTGYMGALLGYPFEICLNRHNMMMVKAARHGGIVEWHQDAGGWRCDKFISLMIMLDDATLANGCLHVVPGVYRDPEFQQPSSRLDLGKAANQEIIRRAVPIECKAGEGYFFHSLTPHMS